MNWLKQFFRRVRRVIDFLPLIWQGEDWDYYYSVELFQYQLKRTADFLESDKAYTLDAKATASRVRTAIELMDRVYNHYYLEISDWSDPISMKEAMAQHIRAERILWKFIAHNIRHWWD